MDNGYSRELEWKVRILAGELSEAGRRVAAHPNRAEVYTKGLFRLYSMVRATIPLLEAALERSRALADSDDVAAAMVPYLEGMIREETGHDHWAFEALKSLGRDEDDILGEIPPAAIATTVGAQSYWIEHSHPVAILGYIKVVERHPSSQAELEQAMADTGHPAEAFVYYTRHVELEKKHNKDLDVLLDSLPLTDAHRALIGISAAATIHGIAGSLGELASLP